MPIHFSCSCGKRLKARSEQAGRLTVCPQCGESVGVPAPRRPGEEPPPMLPQEKRRLGLVQAGTGLPAAVIYRPEPSAQPQQPADPVRSILARFIRDLKDRAKNRRPRRARPLEQHWYQCLLFPIRELGLWFSCAALLSLLVLVGSRLLPEAIDLAPESWTTRIPFVTVIVVGVLFAVGFPCNVLWRTLGDAARGGNSDLAGATYNPAELLRGSLILVGSLLAGPVFLAAGTFTFWLHVGTVRWFDGLILLEMATVTIGYGLLVIASVAEHGRMWDANPARVADLAWRLGPRAILVSALGTLTCALYGVPTVLGLRALSREDASGLGLLALGAFSGLYAALFLGRLLGMWTFRTRPMKSAGGPLRPEGDVSPTP